ncbi:MAG: response regulator transcription factor [Patescibacteria group bacterium]
MNILIVEDQADLAKNIKQYLELENFIPTVASSAEEADDFVSETEYDCIVLDLMLPEMSGMDFCKKLRQEGIETPIIILTARTAKDTIVEALNIGADDYLTKPFDMDELVARIRSMIRRRHNKPNPSLHIHNVEINTNTKSVTQDGKDVHLAPKEYYLLEYLALNTNRVVERREIIEHVWGEFDELMFSQTVDVHISYLRKKLGKDLIQTAPGGYLIKTR